MKIDEQMLKSGGIKLRCFQCSSTFRAIKRPSADGAASVSKEALPGKPGPAPAAEAGSGPIAESAGEGAPAGINDAQSQDQNEDPGLTDGPESQGKKPVSLQYGRKYKRVPFKKKVLVDNAILVEGIDLSEGGLFVHTGRSFIVGSTVQVALPMQAGELIVEATVQHNQSGIGMGLQFADIPDDKRSQLQKYIEVLDAEATTALDDRKIILLAGGSDTARRISKSKLVLEGYYVIEATSDKEVIDSFNNQVPDVIVIDWQDGKINGEDVLATVKKNDRWKKAIAVVQSGVSDREMQQRVLAAGADIFLAKMDTPPIKLAAKLKECLAG